MNEESGGALSLIVGAVLVRLAVTGAHRRYVRVGMGPWLLVAGVVLVTLGLVTTVRALRRPGNAHADEAHASHDADAHQHHDHDHGGERVAWLLVAPILTLLLIAPPALGAFALDRGTARVTTSGRSNWTPLTPTATPVTMTLADFYQRAYDGGASVFNDATVRVTGFVARTTGDGFLVARYQIACCAADATAAVARIVGYAGPTPPRDQWLTITGTFQSVGSDGPRLLAQTVTAITAPADPYE